MNPILRTDSYKMSHAYGGMYPEGIEGMWAYGESRLIGRTITPFGAQMLVNKLIEERVQYQHVEEAQYFCEKHGEPFPIEGFRVIMDKYFGHWPMRIRAIPEGTPVPSNTPLYTVESTEPGLPWVPAHKETEIQRGFWYPTTIASLDREVYTRLQGVYANAACDPSLIPFALHDFGARGVSCGEQAEIGGAAHLVYFQGSDTCEGIWTANRHYKCDMSAFSVPATEHSVQCSYGASDAGQLKYLRDVIENHGKPGGIVSLVIDGYDTMNAVKMLCGPLRDTIIKSGAKVVFRPDSGDFTPQTSQILAAQVAAFGCTTTDTGFHTPKHVGVLWGDGIDRQSMFSLLSDIMDEGYAPNSVIFGSGGGLLQKVDRDTLKFAQKTSAIKVDGNWIGTAKATPGKVSKSGRVSTMRYFDNEGRESYRAYNLDEYKPDWRKGESDAMVTIYENGIAHNQTTLVDVRARATANI